MDRSSSTSMIARPASFSVQLQRAKTAFSGFFRARRAEILIFGIRKTAFCNHGRPIPHEVQRRSSKEHSSVPQLPDQEDSLGIFGTFVRPQPSLRHACEDWTVFLHSVRTLSQRWTSRFVKVSAEGGKQVLACKNKSTSSLGSALRIGSADFLYGSQREIFRAMTCWPLS